MNFSRPTLARRSISRLVALTLLAAALLTLVHWHEDSTSQRCEICFVRNLPSVHVPFAVQLGAPTRIEWHNPLEAKPAVLAAHTQLEGSRAPPLSFS
jgi:hypothetical protein